MIYKHVTTHHFVDKEFLDEGGGRVFLKDLLDLGGGQLERGGLGLFSLAEGEGGGGRGEEVGALETS